MFAYVGRDADPAAFAKDFFDIEREDGLNEASRLALIRQIWRGYEHMMGYTPGDI